MPLRKRRRAIELFTGWNRGKPKQSHRDKGNKMKLYIIYLEFKRGYLDWKICRAKRKGEKLRAENMVLIKEAKDGLVRQLERRDVPDPQRVYLNEVYKIVLEVERMTEEFDNQQARQPEKETET